MKRIKTILFKGSSTTTFNEADKIIDYLEDKREYLHELTTSDLIEYINKLAKYWVSSEISSKMNYSKNILEFFSKENITKNLEISLRNARAMDEFVDLGHPNLLYHAQPRGLSVQWLAGNTPIIGLFSIFLSTLTKNVTLAKVSSKGYRDLVVLLSTMKKVNTKKISGTKLLETIALVLIDHEDLKNQTILSRRAAVRVAWGGREAIEAITELPKNMYCEDIIMGPKYSLALIDNESLKRDLKKIAQKAAVDISVFDQYACSSPHTLFVQVKTNAEAVKFSEELAKQLELVEKYIPKNKIDAGTSTKILEVRSQYELTSKVISSKGTKWTVIFDDRKKGLFEGCFSRVVMVKPIRNLDEISQYIDRQKQTLGLEITQKNKLKHLDKISSKGIDRSPNLGYMTFYEIPWDGMFIMDRLVRWTTINKNDR